MRPPPRGPKPGPPKPPRPPPNPPPKPPLPKPPLPKSPGPNPGGPNPGPNPPRPGHGDLRALPADHPRGGGHLHRVDHRHRAGDRLRVVDLLVAGPRRGADRPHAVPRRDGDHDREVRRLLDADQLRQLDRLRGADPRRARSLSRDSGCGRRGRSPPASGCIARKALSSRSTWSSLRSSRWSCWAIAAGPPPGGPKPGPAPGPRGKPPRPGPPGRRTFPRPPAPDPRAPLSRPRAPGGGPFSRRRVPGESTGESAGASGRRAGRSRSSTSGSSRTGRPGAARTWLQHKVGIVARPNRSLGVCRIGRLLGSRQSDCQADEQSACGDRQPHASLPQNAHAFHGDTNSSLKMDSRLNSRFRYMMSRGPKRLWRREGSSEIQIRQD